MSDVHLFPIFNLIWYGTDMEIMCSVQTVKTKIAAWERHVQRETIQTSSSELSKEKYDYQIMASSFHNRLEFSSPKHQSS